MTDTDNSPDVAEPVAEAPADATENETVAKVDAEFEDGEHREQGHLEAEEGAETEGAEAEPEFVTVEYEGQEYDLPPALKDALLRQADYTRKTQEVAEQRKEFAAQQEAFNQQSELAQSAQKEMVQIASIDQAIANFENINWQAWISEDPVEAMKADRQYRTLQEQRSQAETRLQEAQKQHSEAQQESLAKARQQCAEEVSKRISDWSPELDVKLSQYAEAQGISRDMQARITDPGHVVILDKARRFDELMAKQKHSAKPKPKPVKPAAKVKGKQAAVKDPESMSTEEWVRWREKQIAKKQAI